MFVVEVWTLVVPSLLRMSAGSPDRGSVIAAKDAHVRSAYWCSSLPLWAFLADACPTGMSTSSATSAAKDLTRMSAPFPDGSTWTWRRSATPRVRVNTRRVCVNVHLGTRAPRPPGRAVRPGGRGYGSQGSSGRRRGRRGGIELECGKRGDGGQEPHARPHRAAAQPQAPRPRDGAPHRRAHPPDDAAGEARPAHAALRWPDEGAPGGGPQAGRRGLQRDRSGAHQQVP